MGRGKRPLSNRHEVSSRTPFVRDLRLFLIKTFYCVISSEARNLLRFSFWVELDEGTYPSSNSTQKRFYVFGEKAEISRFARNDTIKSLYGEKAEIPHKRRSGRHFVSVGKGSFSLPNNGRSLTKGVRDDTSCRLGRSVPFPILGDSSLRSE